MAFWGYEGSISWKYVHDMSSCTNNNKTCMTPLQTTGVFVCEMGGKFAVTRGKNNENTLLGQHA